MNGATYTPKLAADVADGGQFVSVLNCTHLDKRVFANAIAEAFINGMTTQERLTAQAPAERSSA